MSIIKGTNKIVAGFGGTKRSIGEVYFSHSSLATDNSGALPLFTGETIASANTIYPDFYNWVLAHTELHCTSAEYESALSTYGKCPKYVIGDGSLRLPKRALSHGVVIKEKKPTDADRTWYRQWSDGWLEQGGYATVPEDNNAYITLVKPFSNTAYQVKTQLIWDTVVTSTNSGPTIGLMFKSSETTRFRVWGNSSFASSSTKIPFYWEAKGMGADGAQDDTLYPWVVAYTAAIPASTAQAAEFQQGLSGKADTNLGNLSAAGKDILSASSLPTNINKIQITPGSSGSLYTAPGNGWFMAQGGGAWVIIQNQQTDITMRGEGQANVLAPRAFVPCLKGQKVFIYYDGSISWIYFLYAEGAE